MARLSGRTALVTGGGQGVGRGIALALAAEGAAVVITGRTEGKLKDTAGVIAERGGRAYSVVGDVGVREDVDRRWPRRYGSSAVSTCSSTTRSPRCSAGWRRRRRGCRTRLP